MNRLQKATLVGLLAVAALLGIAVVATQGAASTSKFTEATAVAAGEREAKERRIALGEAVVRNGSYALPGIGAFQLKDGNFQEKYGEGATQVKRVGVVAVTFGDLDGDKVEDAAVVLWATTGGSGTFIYLAAVLNKEGNGQQAGAQLMGDRVEVRSLAIASGKIKVEVLTQASGDPMVGPSMETTQEYAVQNGTLVKSSAPGPDTVPTPRPTREPAAQPTQDTPNTSTKPQDQQASQAAPAPSGVVGAIWVWQRFAGNGEKDSFLLPYPAAYRLELATDGKFRFQADCNLGTGGYTLDGNGLTLQAGAVTQAECQKGSRSSQFVQMLGQVATYVLKGDALYLNLRMDSGDMVLTKLSAVTGRIVGPPEGAVPGGATAEIMVVNSAGAQIGGSLVKANLPMEFEAPFKPTNIDASGPYRLEVTVKDAQKNAIYKNSRVYQVLTQGNPTYHLEVEVDAIR